MHQKFRTLFENYHEATEFCNCHGIVFNTIIVLNTIVIIIDIIIIITIDIFVISKSSERPRGTCTGSPSAAGTRRAREARDSSASAGFAHRCGRGRGAECQLRDIREANAGSRGRWR